MRRMITFLLILLCGLAFTSYASAEIETLVVELSEKGIIAEAKLPTSIELIEDEAFEGTALIKIELPDKTLSIGEQAFANIQSLQEIKIPFTTKQIASTAFNGSNKATIIAPVNSYARAFARKHGLPFYPIVMFCATGQGTTIPILSVNRSTEVKETENKTNFSPETQWRRIDELTTFRTEELIANHVQGRAPPMV